MVSGRRDARRAWLTGFWEESFKVSHLLLFMLHPPHLKPDPNMVTHIHQQGKQLSPNTSPTSESIAIHWSTLEIKHPTVQIKFVLEERRHQVLSAKHFLLNLITLQKCGHLNRFNGAGLANYRDIEPQRPLQQNDMQDSSYLRCDLSQICVGKANIDIHTNTQAVGDLGGSTNYHIHVSK